MIEKEDITISEIVQDIENEKQFAKSRKPTKEKKSHKGFLIFFIITVVILIGFIFLVGKAGINSKDTQSFFQRIKYMKSIYKEPLFQLKK